MWPNEKRRRTNGREAWRQRSAALRKLPWLQILVAGFTAVVATLFVVSTPHPLPVRAGEISDREIRLRVELNLPNETKTRNKQEESVRLAPLVFVNNVQAIIELRGKIESLASAISKSNRFRDIDELLRSDWRAILNTTSFERLRKIIPNDAAYREFTRKLEKVVEPLMEKGVLDAQTLPSDKERDKNYIRVYPAGSDTFRLVNSEEVLQSEITKPGGAIDFQISQFWSDANDLRLLSSLIASKLRPTLTYDRERTNELEETFRQQVPEEREKLLRGFLVVAQDERVREDHMRLLRAEQRVLAAQQSRTDWLQRFIAIGVLVASLTFLVGVYLVAYEPKLGRNVLAVTTLCAVCLGTMLLARLMSTDQYPAEVLPLAVATMFVAIAFNRPFGMVITLGLSTLISLSQRRPMEDFLLFVGGTSAAILLLDSVRSRTKLILVGSFSGLIFFVFSIAFGMLHDDPWSVMLQAGAIHFACGLIAGFIVSGSLPFVEAMFGIVTDISLIELADTSHPLLQELVRRAPGTYNHSVSVSIIGEHAAQKIGCNALLVRVGALFHDVGKMLKPTYFVENQSENELNRHDQLAPAMSTLIIIGHVKDGIDLAHQHHLPQPIIEMIEQHHGTTRVDYFYHEATKLAANEEADETVEETAFRYPGPKPQSKEAAVMMLADCVESAARTLSEPTASRIEKLVHGLAMSRLLDGQFSESGLTLEEVKRIEESLVKSLASVYHGRIRYPVAV